MAQTKKKRKRKHRGTQAGTVEPPSRSSRPRRPQTKEDRRAEVRRRREERLARPPSWRSAVGRAALAAGLFLAISLFVPFFEGSPTSVVLLATLVAFPVYVIAAYYTDRWRHRRYTKRSEGGGGGPSGGGGGAGSARAGSGTGRTRRR